MRLLPGWRQPDAQRRLSRQICIICVQRDTGPRYARLRAVSTRTLPHVPAWYPLAPSPKSRASPEAYPSAAPTNSKNEFTTQATFASRKLAGSETLPVIGELLAQSKIETTTRCVHLECGPIHEAPSGSAAAIAADTPEEGGTPRTTRAHFRPAIAPTEKPGPPQFTRARRAGEPARAPSLIETAALDR